MARFFSSRFLLAAGVLAFLLPNARTLAEDYKMQGSPVVAHVMVAAAPALRQQGIDIKVAVEGSSTVAAAMMGAEQVDFALMMRPLNAEDRARFPNRNMQEFRIGMQAVALIVHKDVWDSGVRSLTKAQIKDIYEGKITNWKEVGGLNLPIRFFNSERARGLWEIFAMWLYGETRKAPLGKFPITVDGEDARNTVQFTAGGMGMAQINWIDGKQVFGLSVVDEGEKAGVAPTVANVASGKYPLARGAFVTVGDRPVGDIKKVIDFLLGPEGQDIVGKSDLIPLKDLEPLK
jgi:phosphate transport system substrate-binding protein